MPIPYIIAHLSAAILLAAAVSRAPRRPAWTAAIVAATFLIVAAGFVVERRADLAWRIMSWSVQDLVFFTNLAIEGSVVLAAILLREAKDQRAKVRSALLSAPLIAAALWSYSWYFEPLPEDMTGRLDSQGMSLQSSDDTCSPSAGVMLLHCYGIQTSESEMARLCLTRRGKGTSALGLFRGLSIKAFPVRLRPEYLDIGVPRRLKLLGRPVIIAVGLKGGTPPEIARRMEGYGWSYTARHAVLVLGTDASGEWIDVADPSYGRERWPAADLQYLWDGAALGLSPIR